MNERGDSGGCLTGCSTHGCAAVVFGVTLLAVLMVEHAFHIFEGLFWVLVVLLALGALVTGTWQVLRWWLVRMARRMPDDDEPEADEAASRTQT